MFIKFDKWLIDKVNAYAEKRQTHDDVSLPRLLHETLFMRNMCGLIGFAALVPILAMDIIEAKENVVKFAIGSLLALCLWSNYRLMQSGRALMKIYAAHDKIIRHKPFILTTYKILADLNRDSGRSSRFGGMIITLMLIFTSGAIIAFTPVRNLIAISFMFTVLGSCHQDYFAYLSCAYPHPPTKKHKQTVTFGRMVPQGI